MVDFGADLGFWLGAAVISFAVAALLLRGAARGDAGAQDQGAAKALVLYRGQLDEISRDIARGTLAEAEAAPLRAEVQRRILAAARMGTGAPLAVRPNGQWLGLGVVIAALAGAAGLYLRLGAPAYLDLPLSKRLALADAAYADRPTQAQAEAEAPKAPAPELDAEFEGLLTQLRAAVAARPTDVQGLTLLARNEANIGNFAAAAQAYQGLVAAKGEAASPEDHLALAQAMIAAAGGLVTAEAEAALTQVLQRDPQNGMARYFSGLMFAQTGRPDRAFALWEPLLRAGPQDAPWAAPIAQLLPEVAAAAGINYTPPASFGRGAEDIAGAADMDPNDRAVMINTMVTGLEERLLQTGGSADEWVRLITSLGVLGQTGRLKTALAAGRAALAGDQAGLQALQDAAAKAGVTP